MSLLHTLPKAKFVAVWIFEIRKQPSGLFLYRSCRHTSSFQLVRCLTDVSDPKTQACVASTRQRVVWRIGNKFEKHTSQVEASDIIPRDEMKSKTIAIEGNGLFDVCDVVVHSIKCEF